MPILYHHSNLQSEEIIYYVSGNFGSRKGVTVGSITVHPRACRTGCSRASPSARSARPRPASLAVMCDTFHPLRLGKWAKELDDGKYAYSWREDPADVVSPEGEPTGAGLTRISSSTSLA